MIGPLTPKEVAERKQDSIPEIVFHGFNDMITQHWTAASRRAVFSLKKVTAHIVSLYQEINPDATEEEVRGFKNSLFDNYWLDVEPVYRNNGWLVRFEKNGYNETGPENFTFIEDYKGAGNIRW